MMARRERAWWDRYDRYLRSEGWQLTREACFKRDGYRCQRCGLRGGPLNPLQADHLTYQNYNATGQTPISDLRTLCRRCHQIVSHRRLNGLTVRRLMKLVLAAIAIWMLALAVTASAREPFSGCQQHIGDPVTDSFSSSLSASPPAASGRLTLL